jgi:Subtilase family
VPNSGKAAKQGPPRRRATIRPRPANRRAWRCGPLASRGGRIAAAATLLMAAVAAGGLTAAFASTGAAPRSSTAPRLPVVTPAGVTEPAALPVAEPHTGTEWMGHDLMARVTQWAAGKAGCTPTARAIPDTASAQPVPGGCGSRPKLTAAAPPGYGPAQLRAYLKLTGTGAGQTVAVVDAYDNPYAAQDLAAYSKKFGLPLPCGPGVKKNGCFSFSVVHPFGFAGVDAGWALESDLDVQMVHAIAPQASIVLVEAYDNNYTSLVRAIGYAADRKPVPAVISGSWGGVEFSGETAADGYCALARSLCVFSTGDNGNPGEYPAYNPYALAVGGTTLELTAAGQVSLEAAWCCGASQSDPYGSGGGVSVYEPRPAYQDLANPYQGRGTPDVSFDADPLTGVPVYDTFGLNDQTGWFELGGTSVGTPAWAGILAAADQLRAAAGKAPLHGAGYQAQSLIYRMSHATAFGDITQGVNNVNECASPPQACRAHPGYDVVTGWGSPRPGIDTALAGAP